MTNAAGQAGDIRFQTSEKGSTDVALYVDDVKVSWTHVIPMTIRVGLATVRMDGIGGVGTDENHRHKGYSRRVMEAAVELMKDGDAALTSLYGIPDFYPKFGYATIGAQPFIRIPSLDEVDTLPEGYTVRTATADDIDVIASLYDDATLDAVGPVLRQPDGIAFGSIQRAAPKLRKTLSEGADDAFVVANAEGKIEGYAWQALECWWMHFWHRAEPESYKIGEAFATSHQAADAILAEVRNRTRAAGLSSAELAIPFTGKIGLSARLQNIVTVQHNSRAQEFMGRSVGIADLMTALEPELTRRQLLGPDPHTGLVTFDTGEDAVTLALTSQLVKVLEGETADDLAVKLTPGDAARLALGTFDPLALADRMSWPADARPILATLFPERDPYIYPADRF